MVQPVRRRIGVALSGLCDSLSGFPQGSRHWAALLSALRACRLSIDSELGFHLPFIASRHPECYF